jgi:PIN domain nuclease of toxin-antitoxin system
MRAIGAEPLPIEHNHALAVGELPPLHRDPFDRILVAQARGLRLTILTADVNIARYEVETLLVRQP